MNLPSDLFSAENQLLAALIAAIKAEPKGRWSAELRFEGLRILPVALRLLAEIKNASFACSLVFPDAGASALAKRDAPNLSSSCSNLNDWLNLQEANQSNSADLLIFVAPLPPDYIAVESICQNHGGPLLLLNGRLEDAAVGIGSVARARRKGFLATWQNAYSLQPLLEAALLHAYPDQWLLFKQGDSGFVPVAAFDKKPAPEELDEALSNPLGQGLRALDRFLNELS